MLEKNNITIPTINNLLFNNPLSDHIKNLENLEKSMSIVLEYNKIMTESYNLLENTSNLFHNLENISSIFKLSSKIQEPLFFSLSLVSDIQILEHNNLIETIKKLEPSITIPKFPIVSLHENFSKDELEKNEVLNQNKLLIERIEFLLSQLKDKDELINQKDIIINEKNIIINTQKEIIFYYQKKLHSKDNIISLKNELHYYLQEEFSQQSQEYEILKNESKRKNEYFDNHYLKNKSFTTFSNSFNNQSSVNIPVIDTVEVDISKKNKVITNRTIKFKNNLYTVSPLLTDEEIKSNKEKIFFKSKDIELKKLRPIRNYILKYSYASVSIIINYIKHQHQKKISDTSIKKYFKLIPKCYKNICLLTPLKSGKGHELILILNDLIT